MVVVGGGGGGVYIKTDELGVRDCFHFTALFGPPLDTLHTRLTFHRRRGVGAYHSLYGR